jgi:hypothetical protein
MFILGSFILTNLTAFEGLLKQKVSEMKSLESVSAYKLNNYQLLGAELSFRSR